MPNLDQDHQEHRTKFITPGILTEGTIVEVNINQEPFHCRVKILPKDPTYIIAEGRYSDHEVSLGKLKRNLVHLKFNIQDVGDIIAAVESLEGRECVFRVDKSGWISWIPRLVIPEPAPEPAPAPSPLIPAPVLHRANVEVFFVREPEHKSIYRMMSLQGEVWGWAVGPTHQGTPNPHGWVLYLMTMEEALKVLATRKKTN